MRRVHNGEMEQLAKYLSDTGTTQEQFAVLMGVKQSTVSRWIKGQATPNIETAFKIESVTDGEVEARAFIASGRSGRTPVESEAAA